MKNKLSVIFLVLLSIAGAGVLVSPRLHLVESQGDSSHGKEISQLSASASSLERLPLHREKASKKSATEAKSSVNRKAVQAAPMNDTHASAPTTPDLSTTTSSTPGVTSSDAELVALSQAVPPPVPLDSRTADLQTSQNARTAELIALHKTFYEAPGMLLAAGSNTVATGPLQTRTYRIEELSLPQPVTAHVATREVTGQTAWRVTVSGISFPVGALPLVIWANDTIVGVGQPSPDLSTISAITFDRSLLINGATLSVSYGVDGWARTELAEKLRFSIPQ